MDIIIFGISGDLAYKKLIPALSNLESKKKLPEDTRVIGFSRKAKEFTDTNFPYTNVVGDYASIDDFLKLKALLRPDKKHLFYLAVPPMVYRDILQSLSQSEIVTKDDPSGFSLVLIEKPFGVGLQDAQSLTQFISEHFRADQCLKIDHYAGKTELRNLEDEPFADISKVVFEIRETADVSGRSGFYDQTGALRDVGQNHLLFMLSTFFKEGGTRAETLKHLKIKSDHSKNVFAQYEGYLEESGVAPHSTTETFFKVHATLMRDDAKNIDIELIGGKALSETVARISIFFTSGEKKEIILSSGTSAYENIFEDALQGKYATFLSDEEVFEAWRFIEEIEVMKGKSVPVTYPKGSDNMTI